MMKICPKCGSQNPDHSKFCGDCGYNLEDVAPMQQSSSNQGSYQQANSSPAQKNKIIAPILNLILGVFLYCLCGIGHIIYLRLYKRGIILGAVGLFISLIFGFIAIFNQSWIFTAISLVFGIALTIYSAFDAYNCTNAINEGRDIPLLFGGIDTESMSRNKIIAIVVICIIGIFALGGAIVYVAFSEVSQEMANDGAFVPNNVASDTGSVKNKDIGSDSGLQIKITCPVEWSASIGDQDRSKHYEGTGDQVINIDEDDYDVIAAAVQKKQSGSDRLKVEIIHDGKVVDKESSTDNYGVVTVSTSL